MTKASTATNPINRDAPIALEMSGLGAKDVRSWIKRLCEFLNVTPTTLARSANIAPSTINRFVSGRSINTNLSASTLGKIAEAASRIYEHRIYTGEISPSLVDDALGLDSSTQLALLVSNIFVCGSISEEKQASAFYSEEAWYKIRIPVASEYLSFVPQAFEVSANVFYGPYRDGSLVIGVLYSDLDRDPVSGEKIIAIIEHPIGTEVAVKEFRTDPKGDGWLLPLDGMPSNQPAIYAGTSLEALENSRVSPNLFLVVATYQPEPRLAVCAK